MSQTLLDSLKLSLNQLLAKRERLTNELSQIDAEISLAKKMILEAEEKLIPQSKIIEKEKSRNLTRSIQEGTIMFDVMNILENKRNGLIALDILQKLNETRAEPLLRSSLSPQLSRLKQANFIELEGSTWKIKDWEWRNRKKIGATDDLLAEERSAAPDNSPEAKGREAGPGGGA